jgi:hypothetical protein
MGFSCYRQWIVSLVLIKFFSFKEKVKNLTWKFIKTIHLNMRGRGDVKIVCF